MSETADFEFPVAKRQRLDDEIALARHPQGSRLFAPFRTIGLVSPTAVPFTSIALGKTTFQITTSVGRSLQTYDLLKGLSLVFLSRPQTPGRITATHAYRDRVFVAYEAPGEAVLANVWVFKRGRLIAQLEPTSAQSIRQILIFGSWIVGFGQSTIEVWKTATYEHYTTITPTQTHGSYHSQGLTGNICTIPTFLNKVFVGRFDGSVEVYNVRTGKLVHSIIPPSTACGAVTALCSTSALGMLAIAYDDGSLTVHDIESDETFLRLKQPGSHHAISSITFRSDGLGAGEDGRKDGVMATASLESGDITFWDLNEGGRVAGMLRAAHQISSSHGASGITKIEFLPNQPAVLVSSGVDNSLRSWVFDQTPFSHTPRELHSRSGHSAPVTRLRFLPSASDGSEAAGKWLMSAGQDRSFWAFSLRKDGQSTEISQGNVKSKSKRLSHLGNDVTVMDHLKVAPIIDMACSLNRDGGMGGIGGSVWSNPPTSNAEQANATGWESVVTTHDGDSLARTWFWGRKKAGRWTFETSDRSPATSVAVTTCGTFALVGSARGSLDMFNLQSGIHRQRFPPHMKPAQMKKLEDRQVNGDDHERVGRGHEGAITGIVVDSLNQRVVSSSLDGTVRIWAFATGQLLDKITLQFGMPSAMRHNPVSALVSVACDDSCIRVLDIETRRIVRELWGCVGQIYDHCFSHDGRWIVACSMDSIIRVFDLATGHLIDAAKTATCTSMSFSSTGEYLATAHAGELGIRIWTNKSIFKYIPSRQIDEAKEVFDLTMSEAFEGTMHLTALRESDEEVAQDPGLLTSSDIDQLDKALLTLSLVPQSRWQTLLNLEEIRQRNKPIQPPEKPKAAPFFLSSGLISGSKQADTSIFAIEDRQPPNDVVNDEITAGERSRISKLTSFQVSGQTAFTRLLAEFTASSSQTHALPDPSALISYLASLGPSAADLEIRSLTPSELPVFVRALTAQLRRKRDFELVNVWMSVLLRVHGEFLGDTGDMLGEGDGNEDVNEELREGVREWRGVMDGEGRRLGELVGFVRGVVEWLRSAR